MKHVQLACIPIISFNLLGVLGAISNPESGIRGVNLGNWLVFESWMAPLEWQSMGGELCPANCSACAATEYGLVQKLGQSQANTVFNQHWSTWFTAVDVQNIVKLKLNTVRIPLGFWIIESLVFSSEYYPRGGLAQLKRGLRLLKAAKINVILDLHAMPGVSAINQQFAGRCVSQPQFYTPKNYIRGLQASAALTALIHADPDFSTVFALQAINEPVADPSQTPYLGDYYRNFTNTVRATEQMLGLRCPTTDKTGSLIAFLPTATRALINSVLQGVKVSPACYKRLPSKNPSQKGSNLCLTTAFQDATWQWNPSTNNPSKAASGNALYDDHTYLSFGGVTSPDEKSYMTYICNYHRYQANGAYGEPTKQMFTGEFWLAAQFQGSDDFYRQFGDAQKLAYSKGAGWTFWSWKLEANNSVSFDSTKEGVIRNYQQSVAAGLLTADPNALFNDNVCANYTLATKKTNHSKRALTLDLFEDSRLV